MYRLDLLTDEQKTNPFHWLYKDYERDHAHYKVFSNMGLKVCLLLPAILLTSSPGAQLGVSLTLVVGFATFGIYYAPFLDDELDLVEGVSRFTTVISVLLALLIR